MGAPESIRTMVPPPHRPRRATTYATLLPTAFLAMFLFYALLSLRDTVCFSHNDPSCYRGFRSAYSFNTWESHHPSWMADIPDETNLTSLSIPGTHDTMTYEIDSQVLECQNWNLSVQMEAGLRYFDIRARLKDDELMIYHGNGDTGFTYKDVMLDMCTFLEENPSEALVMRLKEESFPLGKNTVTFEQAFERYLSSADGMGACTAEHLYLYNTSEPIPTLGQLRSKIFLLQNFKAPIHDGSYGLSWDGPQMKLEDFWILPDMSFLADKWQAIRKALKAANEGQMDNEVLYLAHVSGSVGVLPIEAAAGSRDGEVKGMNEETGRWLEENHERGRRSGIVIFDFPGKRAIEAVLEWNKRFQ